MAKTVFEQAPLSEQKLGSQFLVLGVSPTQNAGAPEFARVYMVRFSAPDFTPGFMHWGYKVCSIGTGASVDRYKQVLRPYFDLRTLDPQVETVGSSWWGKMIANAVGDAIEENSERGISRHFHVLTCRRDQILGSTNDMTWFAPDGTSETCIAMPPSLPRTSISSIWLQSWGETRHVLRVDRRAQPVIPADPQTAALRLPLAGR
jgi:hypothetical protein